MAVCVRRQPRDDPPREGSRRRARAPPLSRNERLRPLTSRILAWLPGPRVVWTVGWALLPWLNAAANLLLGNEDRSAVWDQSSTLIVLNYAALSFAVLVTVWGAERLAHRLETLPEKLPTAAALDAGTTFREVNSVAVPLFGSAAIAIAFGIAALVDDGFAPALLRGGTWFLLGVPVATFLWTYGSVQVGLDRVGRTHLLRNANAVDPTLGLRPLGAAAFMGLWTLLAWLVPLLLTGLSDIVGVVIGAVVLVVALASFVLSLFRVHRQMVAFKTSELATARDLYAAAYEPVRADPTPDALERRQPLLSAADLLEKRAHAIHEWPLDEGTVARVITITTSVIAITLARLILEPLGL